MGAIISLVLLVASLAMWEWGFRFLGVPSFIVPPASEVVKESVQMWQTNHLLMHTGVTAAEVIAGFVLGSLLGAGIGYLLGMSPTAEFALSPYILALQIAPKVAFAPLFILWMGFTIYPKILVAVLIVFFPVLINVLTAIRAIDFDLINLARLFKATRGQYFGILNSQAQCRNCLLDYELGQRSQLSVLRLVNSSEEISVLAIFWLLAKVKRTRQWYSFQS